MHLLHKDPDQWREPDKYIPDRFNPESPYYLTPSGKKRHPMSFIPFIAGRRICLGKSFAEIVVRVLTPTIVHLFDFEFVNPEHMVNKPGNSLADVKEPVIMMKIKALA